MTSVFDDDGEAMYGGHITVFCIVLEHNLVTSVWLGVARKLMS